MGRQGRSLAALLLMSLLLAAPELHAARAFDIPASRLTAGPIGPVTPQITETAPLGTIPGRFRVDDGGAAHYAVGLELPAAAGPVPALELHYGSDGGNGELGMGWGLGGQSAVSRCAKNLLHDGHAAPVTFTEQDELCLDGQRLLLISGLHWQTDAEYRLFEDDLSRVRIVDEAGCHGVVFEVRRRDGMLDTYGCSDDAVVQTWRGGLRWARSTREDRFGSFIRYHYAAETLAVDGRWAEVDHRLVSVDYGGHWENPALDPSRHVTLSWAPRPDVRTGWLAGTPTHSSLRLRELSSFVDDQLVRRWPLGYGDEGTTGRSRLTTVTECAADGVCRPPTRFDWQDGEAAIEDLTDEGWSFDGAAFPHTIDLQAPEPNALGQLVLDGDGDGLSDMLVAAGTEGSPPPPGRGWEFWQTQPDAGTVAGTICSLNGNDPQPDQCPPALYSLREGARSQLLSASNALAVGIDQPIFAIEADGDGRDEAIAAVGVGETGFAAWRFLLVEPEGDGFGDQTIE
ncbi:MAG: hypothetical protein KC457_21445, partial [Myxococcales bacterium]|nr:hypothetical protein [Myxococcales bacterium]